MARSVVLLVACAAAAAALDHAVPAGRLVDSVRDPQRAAETLGPDAAAGALAGAASWLVLGWIVLATLLLLASALPGALGRLAEAAAGAIVPGALRRLVTAAVGVGVGASVGMGPITGPVAGPITGPITGPVACARPVAHAQDLRRPHAAVATPFGLDWPIVGQPASGAGTLGAGRVVVRHGDTLWGITADHLGGAPSNADIATAWPRWYAANRLVIGADPDLLRPGQRLLAPTDIPRRGTP